MCVVDLRGGARGASGSLASPRMAPVWLRLAGATDDAAAAEQGASSGCRRRLAACAFRHPFVAAACEDDAPCAVRLWALPAAAPVAHLPCDARVTALALARTDADTEAHHAAAADASGAVRVWRVCCDGGDGEDTQADTLLLAVLRLQPGRAHVSALAAWGAGGAALAIGTADGGVALWRWQHAPADGDGDGGGDGEGDTLTWLSQGKGAGCAVHALCAAPDAPGGAADARALCAVRSLPPAAPAAALSAAQMVTAALQRRSTASGASSSGIADVLRGNSVSAACGAGATHELLCWQVHPGAAAASATLAWTRRVDVARTSSTALRAATIDVSALPPLLPPPSLAAASDAVAVGLSDGTLFVLDRASGATVRRVPNPEAARAAAGAPAAHVAACAVWVGPDTRSSGAAAAQWFAPGHACARAAGAPPPPVLLSATSLLAAAAASLSVSAHAPRDGPALCACGAVAERGSVGRGRGSSGGNSGGGTVFRCARVLPDGKRRCAYSEAFD
jgi:hypothetical protein